MTDQERTQPLPIESGAFARALGRRARLAAELRIADTQIVTLLGLHHKSRLVRDGTAIDLQVVIHGDEYVVTIAPLDVDRIIDILNIDSDLRSCFVSFKRVSGSLGSFRIPMLAQTLSPAPIGAFDINEYWSATYEEYVVPFGLIEPAQRAMYEYLMSFMAQE